MVQILKNQVLLLPQLLTLNIIQKNIIYILMGLKYNLINLHCFNHNNNHNLKLNILL